MTFSIRNLTVVVRKELLPLGIKDPTVGQPHPLQAELQGRCQHTQPILYTTSKVNR